MRVAGKQEEAGPVAKGQGEPGSGDGAGDDLSLAADVDDGGAKGDDDAQPDQEKGRRLHHGLGEPGDITQSAAERAA